jgi:hypothetical protein
MTVYAADHDRRRTPQEHQATIDRYTILYHNGYDPITEEPLRDEALERSQKGNLVPNTGRMRKDRVVNPNMGTLMDALRDQIGQIDMYV